MLPTAAPTVHACPTNSDGALSNPQSAAYPQPNGGREPAARNAEVRGVYAAGI